MKIRYLDLKPHVGGLTKITAVVQGNIGDMAKVYTDATYKPEEYELIIQKIKNKRSLDANAYYWKLVDKLASALGSSKQEVHTTLMERYGTLRTDEEGQILTFIVNIDQDPCKLTKYPVFLQATPEGYSVYGMIKDSHLVNTHEFSKLLDGAISEAKDMGIEVLSDIELKRLMNDTGTGNQNV